MNRLCIEEADTAFETDSAFLSDSLTIPSPCRNLLSKTPNNSINGTEKRRSSINALNKLNEEELLPSTALARTKKLAEKK